MFAPCRGPFSGSPHADVARQPPDCVGANRRRRGSPHRHQGGKRLVGTLTPTTLHLRDVLTSSTIIYSSGYPEVRPPRGKPKQALLPTQRSYF